MVLMVGMNMSAVEIGVVSKMGTYSCLIISALSVVKSSTIKS